MEGSRKYQGELLITDPDTGETSFGTRQCCHCGEVWVVQPGSGKTRGFCTSCMGPVCGKKCFDACIPQDLYVDFLAEGRDPHKVDMSREPKTVFIPKD